MPSDPGSLEAQKSCTKDLKARAIVEAGLLGFWVNLASSAFFFHFLIGSAEERTATANWQQPTLSLLQHR
jgi:hypothetical protein